MEKNVIQMVGLILTALMVIGVSGCNAESVPGNNDFSETNVNGPANEGTVALPYPPVKEGSVAEALYSRVSRRDFSGEALLLSQVGSLVWSAGGVGIDGVSGPTRTSPSAGGTYPLDLYLVAGAVEGLKPGIYRYDHSNHSLEVVVLEDRRQLLAEAALGQSFIADAPIVIALVAHYERTTARYGERGERYVYMDAGYASQSIYLQAEEMELGTVAVGAFDDAEVAGVLSTEGEPLLIMPVGQP